MRPNIFQLILEYENVPIAAISTVDHRNESICTAECLKSEIKMCLNIKLIAKYQIQESFERCSFRYHQEFPFLLGFDQTFWLGGSAKIESAATLTLQTCLAETESRRACYV